MLDVNSVGFVTNTDEVVVSGKLDTIGKELWQSQDNIR